VAAGSGGLVGVAGTGVKVGGRGVAVAGWGVEISVDKATGGGVTEDTGDGEALGTTVGDGGTDIGGADADGFEEVFAAETGLCVAAGIAVPPWHAASNDPRAPQLNPTNLRRDKVLTEVAFSCSSAAFSMSPSTLSPVQTRASLGSKPRRRIRSD
jgi:hypothetical protein